MNMELLNLLRTTSTSGSDLVRPGARQQAVVSTPGKPTQSAPAPTPVGGDMQQDAREAIAEANRQLAQKSSELTFEFDETAARVIAKLVDKQTGQVLRQIPSKEALQIARALQDESAGALLRTDA